MRIYRQIPVRAILENGKKIDFLSDSRAEPSFIHAAVFAVASWLSSGRIGIDDTVVGNTVQFLRSPGLDPEYVMLFLKHLYHNRTEEFARFRSHPEFRRLAGELVDLRKAMYEGQ